MQAAKFRKQRGRHGGRGEAVLCSPHCPKRHSSPLPVLGPDATVAASDLGAAAALSDKTTRSSSLIHQRDGREALCTDSGSE